MSSKNSITQLSVFVTKKIPMGIPKKLHSLYEFGIRSFTIQPLVSCNANARMAHLGSRAAAEQQMFRLLRHHKLFLLVWQSLAKQSPLKSTDRINVDYSNLGPLAILGFAKQTRHGRAQPVLMRSLASNTQGHQKSHPSYTKIKQYYALWKKTLQADQFTFVVKSLRLLRYLYGCQPSLVFDRGFANKTLIQFLCDNDWLFYIRMRDDFFVSIDGIRYRVSELSVGNHTIVWGERTMRLVVSKPRKRYQQPWYIITNDVNTNIDKITRYYYHRFEIEESFRDLKSIYHLKHSRVRTWQSLRVVLCFMSIALIVALRDVRIRQGYRRSIVNTHIKKSLSLIRIWQELVQHEQSLLLARRLGF